MTLHYDPLVYLGLIGVLGMMLMIALVIVKVPEEGDLETRKLRFAASTCAAIVMLFIFSAILYFVDANGDANGSGKEIFDRAVTSMSPLVGVIIGYFFSSRGRRSKGNTSGENFSGYS
jgi:cytochrome bd-type quinol oxidase subunit 2